MPPTSKKAAKKATSKKAPSKKAEPKKAETPPMDAETCAMLDRVRKGKALRFAMICKGANVLGLSIFKKGQPDAKLRGLKNAGFKGIGYTGVVRGKVMDITFELAAADGYEKEPVREAIIRKFLKDHADLAAKPTFEIVRQLSAVTEDEEGDAESTGSEATESGADLSPFIAALKQVTPKLQQAIKSAPETKDDLMGLVKEVKTAIDAGDADGARSSMIRLSARLKALRGEGDTDTAATAGDAPAVPLKPVDLDAPDPRAGRAALRLWQDAKETVDERLGVLITALKSSGDPDLERIADKGLAAITGKLQTGLRVALTNLDGAAGSKRAAAVKKVTSQTAEFRAFLSSDGMVRLVDDNPFGVKVKLAKTIGAALEEIDALVGG
ncbi:MAG: hypothetical protein AAF138_01655 [Planctomycetota bacterium]